MSAESPPTETASLTPPAPEQTFVSSPTVPVDPAPLSVSAALTADPATLRPRTRWAAIIWGAVLATIAAVALWVTVSPDRRTALADWTVSLSPAAVAAYVVLVLGAIALVAGLVGILRRAQRALDTRRTDRGPAG